MLFDARQIPILHSPSLVGMMHPHQPLQRAHARPESLTIVGAKCSLPSKQSPAIATTICDRDAHPRKNESTSVVNTESSGNSGTPSRRLLRVYLARRVTHVHYCSWSLVELLLPPLMRDAKNAPMPRPVMHLVVKWMAARTMLSLFLMTPTVGELHMNGERTTLLDL